MILFSFYWFFSIPNYLFDDSKSTVLFAENGNLLGAKISDDYQWRFPHSDSVPYKFKMAILEFEDKEFYAHMGFSFKAFARAIKQNLSEGEIVSGASTISMQCIRMAEKNKDRTILTKLLETIKATRLEVRYSKDEILALYASNAPMGGNVVGLDAASWRYFGRPANDLSWAEASTLAVLPNAPGLIHPGRNRKDLLEKRNRLLKKLFRSKLISREDYELALEEHIPEEPLNIPQLATHVLQNISKGSKLHSTINFTIQDKVNQIVSYHSSELNKHEIHNISVVIIDVETGDIVSYVGNSKDKNNNHNNYVDVASSARSTGSILKPLLYAGMLNEGKLTPSMLIKDVPFFSNNYAPQNYDKKYRGAVHAEKALARSLNVPAVQLLRDYGVQKFKYQLTEMGLSTINRSAENYGLTLVLGGAEARLDELTSVYASMANKLIKFSQGDDSKFKVGLNQASKKEVSSYNLSPSSIYYTFDALLKVSRPEDEGNWESFSSSQKIAWKTGTSFGFKDAWAIGVTSKYAVGVWVGNADGEGRPGIIGIEAAAPILFNVFDVLPKSDWFEFPYDDVSVANICRKSGHLATPICDVTDSLKIPTSSLNSSPCPYHQLIHLNTKNERVNKQCETGEINTEAWFVLPPIVEKYYTKSHPDYIYLPPVKEGCGIDQKTKSIEVIYPKNNQRLFLPKSFEGEETKFVLEAVNNSKSKSIYWHINDDFITQTEGEHQIEINLKKGNYNLTIMNNLGEESSVSFKVIEPD